MIAALIIGFGLGASVAAQLGPISLLAIRSTLRNGLAGAAVLAFLGVRTLWSAFRIRMGGEAREEHATPRSAFITTLGATAANPLTIVSWAAIFAAASTAGTAKDAAVLTLLAGVGLGSLTWMVVLTGGVSIAGRLVGDRLLRAVDGVAGSGRVAVGGLLAYRTLRD
jgi:putative LysE/RhtB family amino acid efflux pump